MSNSKSYNYIPPGTSPYSLLNPATWIIGQSVISWWKSEPKDSNPTKPVTGPFFPPPWI